MKATKSILMSERKSRRSNKRMKPRDLMQLFDAAQNTQHAQLHNIYLGTT